MPRKVIAAPTLETVEIDAILRSFLALKAQKDLLEERMKAFRDTLSKAVEQDGEPDDKGHLILDLPEAVDGYRRLVRQRRVKRVLDEAAAERILQAAGLTERCYKMLPVLDEDAVMQALFDGELTNEDVDRMFPTTVTWAFLPVRD